MNFPILPIIVFTPTITAIIIMLMPPEKKTEVRVTAAAGALVCLALSAYAYFAYDLQAAQAATTWAGKLQYQFGPYPWIESIGISLYMGVDGLSVAMVLLTGVVGFTAVLISWGIDERPREYFAFIMLLATGIYGAFVSLDVFQLFFFYELVVLPIYVLIVVWGWKVLREYAAMKLTLYLLTGSVFALIGVLAIYFIPNMAAFEDGQRTFNLVKLTEMAANGAFNIPVSVFGKQVNFEVLWFLPIFIGFSVLAGIWPLHSWSPDGYVAAPTAVSMFHAGVLKNVGAFTAMRIGIQLLPNGAKYWLPIVVLLTLVNVIYASLIAFVQKDFKYVIGFSSVSHMGLVTMGFATMAQLGFVGGGMQMFSHGVMTALMFAIVGMIYDRAHTRQIPELSGIVKVLPLPTLGFIIGSLVSMGMPGFSGFTAELPIFLGVWKAGEAFPQYRVIAIISILGVVITAAYLLCIVQKVFFGEYEAEKWHDMRPISVLDKVAIVFLASILILVGVYPQIIAPLISSAVEPIIHTLTMGGV